MAETLQPSQFPRAIIVAARRSLALLSALAYWICASIALAQTAEFQIKPQAPSALGRIDLLSPSGDTAVRLTGLRKPSSLSVNPDGSFFVIDRATNEVFLIADNGGNFSVARTWKIPDHFPYILRLFHEPSSDSLIIAHGIGGFWRIGADGSESQLPPPPEGKALFSTAGALTDGRFLISRQDAEAANASVYLFNPTNSSWQFLTIEWRPGDEPFVPNGVSVFGDSVYIWRIGYPVVVEGSLSGNVFKPSRVLHAPGPQFLAGTPDEGLVAVSMEGTVTQLSKEDQSIGSFVFYVQPTALGFLPTRKLIALSYEHPVGDSWPEVQDQLLGQQERHFDWATFWTWIGAASALALLWSIVALLFCQTGLNTPLQAAPAPRGSVGLRRAVMGLAILGSSAGLWLAWSGQNLLLSGAPQVEWLTPYVAGALLVALSLEAWRRFSPAADEPAPFTAMMRGAIPACSWLYMIPTLAIGALAIYVYQMGVDRSYFGLRESAFCAGLIFVSAIVMVEAIQCRRELLHFVKHDWLFFGLPLAVGVVTFFYRLPDVPYNCHFDFTLNSFFAGQFLRGRVEGGWDWGYVPGPAFGTLPEMIGLLLGGFTPLGYRIGNSLFNITGLFAAYLLGRTYRNPRVGFWAALLLAGNIAFIHFGRLQSNGSSATVALWTLALFALALKYKRISLWTLVGLASGFSFYQWPVARVGFTAVGCFYAMILLRYPATQLRQYRQLLAGLFTFMLMLAPLIIMWVNQPERLMPRAEASMTGIAWHGGKPTAVAEHPTLQFLYRSFAWLFNEHDRSSQGTVGPGFNSVEAVLFACGCVVLLIEGLSFNVLLGGFLLITFLVCGAFAVGPPWYTRLLPTAPVACVLVARVMEGLHNLFATRRWLFLSLLPLSCVAVITVSTVPNFQKYMGHEMGTDGGRYLAYPMVAIGRRIHDIGPEPTYILLARGNRSWMLKSSHFAVMLPYVHDLRIKEAYDLADELQVPPGTSKGFIVQLPRKDMDLPEILKAHPGSAVETIKDVNDDPVALLVLVKH